MNKILVSIVIATCNGGRYMEKAISGILDQNYDNFEIIVVDDGSSDDTLLILKEIRRKDERVKIISNGKNLGFAKSLNIGVKAASGKYIARLDDDDIWIDKDKTKKQVEFLEKNKEYILVGGGVIVKKESDGEEVARYLFPEKDEKIRMFLLSHNLFLHSGVVFPKSVFDKVGGYDEKFGFFADADLWLKMGTTGKMSNFQEYFTVYLDKEQDGKYSSRDTQIRRRLFARIKMKWNHRKNYRGFSRALFLCLMSYAYSFLPFKPIIKPALFKIRIKMSGIPYKYSK